MTETSNLDMTIMIAMHDAFRRDLEHVEQMPSRSDGWDLFERFLRLHHTAEDEALWPMLREALPGRPDDLALVDEMEAEHAVLEPLLDVINAGLQRGDTAPDARAELASKLRDHLAHEERDALPLIDVTLTEEQWMQFGQTSTKMIGADGPTFWPWMLDDADAELAAAALSVLPEPVKQMYRSQWQPAYAAKDWWAT